MYKVYPVKSPFSLLTVDAMVVVDVTELNVIPQILSTHVLVVAVIPAVVTCIVTSIVLVAHGIVIQSKEHTVPTFVPGPMDTLKAMLIVLTKI